MGLAVWFFTALSDWLERYRVGRFINRATAITIIALAIIEVLGLLNLTIAAALGYYP